jgi:hypothetical protein
MKSKPMKTTYFGIEQENMSQIMQVTVVHRIRRKTLKMADTPKPLG